MTVISAAVTSAQVDSSEGKSNAKEVSVAIAETGPVGMCQGLFGCVFRLPFCERAKCKKLKNVGEVGYELQRRKRVSTFKKCNGFEWFWQDSEGAS
ncbi:MAG: hypothetical protein ACKOEO_08865 [Planctomycetaceae bacterium]